MSPKSEPKQTTDTHAEGNANGHDNHPFKITIRTMAGHNRLETVKPNDRVAEIVEDAVKHFATRGDITAGEYALTLPRATGEAELDPTATLRDAGVVEGDVLVLVSRKIQVDG